MIDPAESCMLCARLTEQRHVTPFASHLAIYSVLYPNYMACQRRCSRVVDGKQLTQVHILNRLCCIASARVSVS